MKALCLLCAALCVATLTARNLHASESTPSIVGTWLGIDDENVKGGFVFNADGTADMIREGVSFKAAVVKDTGTITYKFNPNVTPHALDIIVTRKTGGSQTLECIVEFLDGGEQIRMRQPNGGPRPKDFNGAKNEVIVLRRTKT